VAQHGWQPKSVEQTAQNPGKCEDEKQIDNELCGNHDMFPTIFSYRP